MAATAAQGHSIDAGNPSKVDEARGSEIYFCLERGEGREKESEKHLVQPLLGTRPATQACALTGNPTSDPLLHSLALNPLSHTSQC